MLRLIRLKGLDFVYAMGRLVDKYDFVKEAKKMGVTPSESLIKIVEFLGTQVSMKTYEMLKILCEKYHLDQLLLAYVLENPEITPEMLIDQIKQIDAASFYEIYVEKVIKPKDKSDIALKEKIETHFANNTNPIMMSYVQLKKFKRDAPVILKDFIETTALFWSAYQGIQKDVDALYESEVPKILTDMQDVEAFKMQYIMLDLNELQGDIDAIHVSVSIMGEFILSYSLLTEERLFAMTMGFGIRQLKKPHDEAFELEVFKCLGDPTKLKMIRLAAQEPLCAKDFTDRLELSKATISHHINVLISLRLLKLNLQEGKKLYYITDKRMLERFLNLFIHKLDDKRR